MLPAPPWMMRRGVVAVDSIALGIEAGVGRGGVEWLLWSAGRGRSGSSPVRYYLRRFECTLSPGPRTYS